MTSPPSTARRRLLPTLRTTAPALAMLLVGTCIGATTQHFASASVSSGERAVLVPIEPCRLADTRPAPNTVGPRSAPLTASDTHSISAQQAGTPCTGLIPTDASALALNITALGATQQSFLTIWASGDRPLAAGLNPAPGEPPVPNAVTTALAADQSFQIYNNAGSVAVVVDVTGYYVDHNHDDRYYTETETDAMFLTETESDARYLAPSIDEIVVGGTEFNAHGAGWVYQDLFWRHSPTVDRECALTPLELPVGRSVESIELLYSAAVDGVEIDVGVYGMIHSPVAATVTDDIIDLYLGHVGFAVQRTQLDEIESATIVSQTPVNGLTPVSVSAGHDPLLEICTTDEFILIGATVHLD